VRDAYGAPDVLRLEDVDEPTPGDDEVLVRVHASSINAGDRLLLRGEPRLMRPMTGIRRPRRRGMGQDVAGRVEAVGPAVTDLRPGDEVFGEITLGAAWAELATAPAARLARKPGALSFEAAATLPVAGVTALQAVRDHGRVRAGQSVLVHGASGGVGGYVLQIARAFGAEVTAVCRPRHLDRARELGAAHVVDATNEDFTREGRRYDVLLDVAGGRSLAECRRVLTPRGTYVSIGGPVGRWGFDFLGRLLHRVVVGAFARQRLVGFVTSPRRESLDTLAELAEAGRLVPTYGRRCKLSEVPDAIRSLEAGREAGKVVVRVG